MESVALTNQLPVFSLVLGSVNQPEKLRQGDRNSAPITQVDAQRVFRYRHYFSVGDFDFNHGSSHSGLPLSAYLKATYVIPKEGSD